jgi:hypothetical protein
MTRKRAVKSQALKRENWTSMQATLMGDPR